MKSICYIVPYFGKLPDIMPIWLKSCELNPSINWILFTDDSYSKYNIPSNVSFYNLTFDEMKKKIQSMFPFTIRIDSPYRLCDYKVAYGYIFEEELKSYDFWGYCDLDMIFGDIRSFLTNDILNNYDRIGFLGHSTLYRNEPQINQLFMSNVDGIEIYKKIFSSEGSQNCFFDEKWIDIICDNFNIKTYRKTIFADIIPWAWKFRIGYCSKVEKEKNEHRIFYWDNGKLFSYSIDKSRNFIKDEFMYIHLLKRRMKFKRNIDVDDKLLIIPNKIKSYSQDITPLIVKRYSINYMILYWYDLLKAKWRKISVKNLINYFSIRRKAQKRYYSKK